LPQASGGECPIEVAVLQALQNELTYLEVIDSLRQALHPIGVHIGLKRVEGAGRRCRAEKVCSGSRRDALGSPQEERELLEVE
jgi:hypothetical protein